MVTILIAYAVGTERVLRTCLAAINRHDAGYPYRVRICGDLAGASQARSICESIPWNEDINLSISSYPVPDEAQNSTRHIILLDQAMTMEDGLVLTLDSDCFPVADGWLAELVQWHDDGFLLPGILWPWGPPPMEVKGREIEWRVRNHQNWHNTWVACQLVHTDFIRDHNLSYGGWADDTGFALIDKANEFSTIRKGWMPTRCARASYASGFDNEFNRLLCVVYGDKILHIGGASRKEIGCILDPAEYYEEAVHKTLRRRGGEWILEAENSHVYQFDREEEVAAFKMKMMYAGMKEYLKTHTRIFNQEPT